jgi:GTPase SAR1 family protein
MGGNHASKSSKTIEKNFVCNKIFFSLPKSQFLIGVIGNKGVGKTSLLQTVSSNQLQLPSQAEEKEIYNYSTNIFDTRVNLECKDTINLTRFGTLMPEFFEDMKGVIIVNERSYENSSLGSVIKWMDSIQNNIQDEREFCMQNIIFAQSKVDLIDDKEVRIEFYYYISYKIKIVIII